MTEDNRFLPFFLREPVYVVAEPKTAPVAPALPVAGAGAKDVLVLVHEPDHPFLAPADHTFLNKILQAVNLSADDIALVNWHPAHASLHAGQALEQQLPAQEYLTTIVFGEVPQPWSQSDLFEKYTVKNRDTRRFLQADALITLSQDPERKVRLWKCLQQLFL